MEREVEPRIVSYLYDKASREKRPIGGTFELLPFCNMDCRMCYIRMTPEEQRKKGTLLTNQQWLSLAKEIKEQGTLFLLLTGGEPFLKKDFRSLYETLHKMGFIISINSNGTLIDESTVSWLKKCPPSRINISLYGASDETYMNLCRYEMGFTKVTNAIEMLKKAGIDVKLSCSLTPYNIHDLEKMIEFAKREELILEIAVYMFPPARKGILSENQGRFSPEDAGKYVVKTDLIQKGEEVFLEYMKTNPFEIKEKETKSEGDKIKCRGGNSAFWISWNGKMTGCGLMERPWAEPLETGFQRAWEKIVEETKAIRLPWECANCERKKQCSVCAAAVLAETGTFHKKPDYLCSMCESYQNNCMKKYRDIEGKGVNE